MSRRDPPPDLNAPLPSIVIESGSRTPEEIFNVWQSSITPYFETTPVESLETQAAQEMAFTLTHAGEFLFLDSQIPAQRLTRSLRWLRRNDDADHVLLQTFIRGNSHATCGGQAYLEDDAGVFAVNLGYESQGFCSNADVITLVLPRHWLSTYSPRLAALRGRVFPEGSVAEALFRNHMIGLKRELSRAGQDDIPLLSQSLLGLLGSLYEGNDPGAAEARSALLGSIQAYIEANLGDPALTVETILQRFRVSRATLFRLFKDLGGVASYVQRRRLLACFRALCDPTLLHRRVYDIALDYGLTNPGYLGALFREHFGMLPMEVREIARGRLNLADPGPPAGAVPDDEAATMRAWAKTLGLRFAD